MALLEGGRDIRARRKPWVVQTLTAATTYRKVGRVVALLLLDLLGVFAAIWTALAVKAVLLGSYHGHQVFTGATEFLAFAYLIMVLLFARAGLYGPRETRPGLARVIATLFQATVIALIFALVNGTKFNSYWIFYGSLVFGAIYISSLRHLYEVITGRLLDQLGYQRRAVLVGT